MTLKDAYENCRQCSDVYRELASFDNDGLLSFGLKKSLDCRVKALNALDDVAADINQNRYGKPVVGLALRGCASCTNEYPTMASIISAYIKREANKRRA